MVRVRLSAAARAHIGAMGRDAEMVTGLINPEKVKWLALVTHWIWGM